MTQSMWDRATDLCRDGRDGDVDAMADQMAKWVAEQAEVVRALGRPVDTRAVVSVSRASDGTDFECSFFALNGDCYSVRIETSGTTSLSAPTVQVIDPTAAATLVAASLEALGMPATLL